MTSKSKNYSSAYVWIFLPKKVEPVVAGKLTFHGKSLIFNYGRSYLAREDAIAIYEPELPLTAGLLPLLPGMNMPSCIRDASPDAWGRRVIINRQLSHEEKTSGIFELDELTYLLESSSDRIGGLDFQLSANNYEPRALTNVPLAELLEAADRVDRGQLVSKELDQALNHGTSIGGARPKALVEEKDKKYIAKFSSSTDLFSVVKAEFISMRLAKLCGLNVASVSIVQSANKDVLLIERFDRVKIKDGWQRRTMVSALTILGLDEMMARYASYENLSEIIRYRFLDASNTLRELFGRIVFNILTGNTDDHARNHAAFCDGKMLELTPAYDICPQSRSGNESSQAMLIFKGNRMSQISVCLTSANNFLLSGKAAQSIVEHQINTIKTHWQAVCEQAKLSESDQKLMWHRQFLNPFTLEGTLWA